MGRFFRPVLFHGLFPVYLLGLVRPARSVYSASPFTVQLKIARALDSFRALTVSAR